MNNQIQLFKPIFATDEILDEIRECLEVSWTGLGFKTTKFEDEFKKYTGLPNAHFLNSATSGLHLALEIIKQRVSSHLVKRFVVTTPLTFIATNHVISHANKEHWFVDIDDTLTIDPNSLEKILRRSEDDILAVIFVALGGNTGNLAKVSELCTTYHVPLILDASHAAGTWIEEYRHIGHEADFTIFSFQAVKNLPTADSGMICCKFKGDDIKARKLSWLGIDKDTYTRQTSGGNWDYDVVDYGYKYHGNSIMASMGLVQLKYLQNDNNIRRSQAEIYDIKLNKSFYLRIKLDNSCKYPSRHLYQLRVRSEYRKKIITHCREKGIQLGVHYKSNTEYGVYISQRQFVPVATQIWKELISLPIGPHVNEQDQNRIIEVLNEFANTQ